MSRKNRKDGRRNNQPPKEHQFKPGQSGNMNGRPKKRKSTYEDDIKAAFGTEREVTIDGKTEAKTLRQIILEQIAIGAAKGDPKMIKLSQPFLKVMDDAPELEMGPDDRKIFEDFKNRFSDDGEETDDEN